MRQIEASGDPRDLDGLRHALWPQAMIEGRDLDRSGQTAGGPPFGGGEKQRQGIRPAGNGEKQAAMAAIGRPSRERGLKGENRGVERPGATRRGAAVAHQPQRAVFSSACTLRFTLALMFG